MWHSLFLSLNHHWIILMARVWVSVCGVGWGWLEWEKLMGRRKTTSNRLHPYLQGICLAWNIHLTTTTTTVIWIKLLGLESLIIGSGRSMRRGFWISRKKSSCSASQYIHSCIEPASYMTRKSSSILFAVVLHWNLTSIAPLQAAWCKTNC